MKSIVIVLPTYNERDNVSGIIDQIRAVFKLIKGYHLSILVVDDYSPDGTGEIVKKLAQKNKDILMLSKQKEGLGAAYVFGMNYALTHLHPDFFVQMDADGQHDPALLVQFVKAIEKGADFVIGSRYIKGGAIPANWGVHRKIYSVTGNFIVRAGLGAKSPHDWTSGYRMMKSSVYAEVAAGLEKYSGYTFQVAFLHRVYSEKYKIAEVPLRFVDRAHGKSKIAPFDYITNLLLYILNNSTLIKYLIIGFLGFLTQTLVSKLLISLGMAGTLQGAAVMVGSFCAIVTNFFGNNLWTFGAKRVRGLVRLFSKFIQFLISSIGAVIIQGVVVAIGTSFWKSSSAWFWLMMFSIIFLVIPYNYFIYNKFIWKTHEK